MYAVIRETTYHTSRPFHESDEFQAFQRAHADQKGYRGTTVTDVGDGRFITITFWETAADMRSARDALGPVVERLLNPMMTAPTKLYGTGQVVVNDLMHYQVDSC